MHRLDWSGERKEHSGDHAKQQSELQNEVKLHSQVAPPGVSSAMVNTFASSSRVVSCSGQTRSLYGQAPDLLHDERIPEVILPSGWG